MCAGVSKSGSPISRWMTRRPDASSAFARASTSKAVSVPRRSRLTDSSAIDGEARVLVDLAQARIEAGIQRDARVRHRHLHRLRVVVVALFAGGAGDDAVHGRHA